MIHMAEPEINNFVCVNCWNPFECSHSDVQRGGGTVECPHCGAGVPVPEEDDVNIEVDLEDAIAEELVVESSDESEGASVMLGEASFMEVLPAGDTEDAEGEEGVSVEFEEEEEAVEIEEEEEEAVEIEEEEEAVEIEEEEEEEEAVEIEEDPSASEEEASAPGEEASKHEAVGENVEVLEREGGELSDVPTDLDPEGVVWKLLIPGGLTYNFHGLQALLRWASGKRNLHEVAVSLDGMRWRNCGKFVELIESNIPAGDALRQIKTLDAEEEEEAAPEKSELGITEQLATVSEQASGVDNPTVELKGVVVPAEVEDDEALFHEGGVAEHVGDTRFGGGANRDGPTGPVPAVTGQFTFQVETNYKSLGSGTKWAARIIYVGLGLFLGLLGGAALHAADLWTVIFGLFSP